MIEKKINAGDNHSFRSHLYREIMNNFFNTSINLLLILIKKQSNKIPDTPIVSKSNEVTNVNNRLSNKNR